MVCGVWVWVWVWMFAKDSISLFKKMQMSGFVSVFLTEKEKVNDE